MAQGEADLRRQMAEAGQDKGQIRVREQKCGRRQEEELEGWKNCVRSSSNRSSKRKCSGGSGRNSSRNGRPKDPEPQPVRRCDAKFQATGDVPTEVRGRTPEATHAPCKPAVLPYNSRSKRKVFALAESYDNASGGPTEGGSSGEDEEGWGGGNSSSS